MSAEEKRNDTPSEERNTAPAEGEEDLAVAAAITASLVTEQEDEAKWLAIEEREIEEAMQASLASTDNINDHNLGLEDNNGELGGNEDEGTDNDYGSRLGKFTIHLNYGFHLVVVICSMPNSVCVCRDELFLISRMFSRM